MLSVQSFTFNPFSENTYLVYNQNGDCIIIDPGTYNAREQEELTGFIYGNGLSPKMLLNTHCHIDHIFGNTFCSEKFNLPLQIHPQELPVLASGRSSAALYNLQYHESVSPGGFLQANSSLFLGEDEIRILFTPGHSPGSVSFYCRESGFVIAGDALFKNSIGRTDLPGGDYQTLIQSIRQELLTLEEDTVVYSGHGPATSIGDEKRFNPFLQD